MLLLGRPGDSTRFLTGPDVSRKGKGTEPEDAIRVYRATAEKGRGQRKILPEGVALLGNGEYTRSFRRANAG
jgi:hypothetical protein